MMQNRPAGFNGLHHVALCVDKLEECEKFYVNLLGMQVEWKPDEDNVYLTSGNDNLALHRVSRGQNNNANGQRLDHIGFIIQSMKEVDTWYEYLLKNSVKIAKEPRTHRDGARSFYCYDPDGTVVQFIYHPPLLK